MRSIAFSLIFHKSMALVLTPIFVNFVTSALFRTFAASYGYSRAADLFVECEALCFDLVRET